MTEQQQHLSNLLEQRDTLVKQVEALQTQLIQKRELALKVQGAIEYLEQIGVTVVTEPELEEESEAKIEQTVQEVEGDS